MTKKDIDRLKNWNFGKKPIGGYIELFPSAAKYIKNLSTFSLECIEKYKVFTLSPDHNGFKINEYTISCITRQFTGIPSEKVSIPYKHIQKVRLYNYNH